MERKLNSESVLERLGELFVHRGVPVYWFSVVATVRRLVTYYVLVVIELSSRKVHIAGITPGPDGPRS